MGSLKDFDLPKLQERFRLKVLVETGTGEGHSLKHALEVATWDEVHTIEVDPTMHIAAIEMVANLAASFRENPAIDKPFEVMSWLGRSVDKLPKALEQIAGKGPALLWLDAHFPGELSGATLTDEVDMSVRLPLKDELRTILHHRDCTLDLFIIDDAWIYRDGIAECGDWEQREAVTDGSSDDFIREYLDDSHLLFQDPRANGYTIAIPLRSALYLLEDSLGQKSKLLPF